VTLVIAAACGGHAQAPPPEVAGKGFNVILVSVDTLRADRLGCYGYKARKSSPHMDALAGEGVLFENFMTSCPWTTPAHLSMLTSLYPVTHGLTASFVELWKGLYGSSEFYRLPEHRVTLAETLKAAGYATAAFTAGGPLNPKIGFSQGFDIYDTSMFKLYEDNVGEMFAWIEANSNRPFFLFWHHFEVHAPYLHTDFLGDVLPTATAALLQSEMKRIRDVPLQQVWPKGAVTLRKRQQKALNDYDVFNRDVCEAMYVSGVLSADRWLGRLVSILKDKGLYDRTLIVLTSDHGEEFADHGRHNFYNLHGHILYEEMVHAPLIIKLPNQRSAGTRIAPVVRMIDVMPTILDVLGVTPAEHEMQGRPLLSGEEPTVQRPAFFEVLARKYEKKGLRTDRYKYIVNIDEQTVAQHGREYLPEVPPGQELYDLENDPGEKRNLLAAGGSKEINTLAAEFYRELQQYLTQERGQAEPITLDEETIEKLKALGYIGN
jgi:arylsulfatase A-like enzyme